MKRLYILTGPPGAGKNTIAELWAKKTKKSVVIDVDLIRWMVRNPHRAPWQGAEGKRQQLLGVRHAALLAQSFLQNQYSVMILDVLSKETIKEYKELLKQFTPTIILLLPTFETITKRNNSRPPRLKSAEIKMLYQQQQAFTGYTIKLDNSEMSAEGVIKRLRH